MISGSPGSVAAAIEIFHGALISLPAGDGCANELPSRPQPDNSTAAKPTSGTTTAALEANWRKFLRFKFISGSFIALSSPFKLKEPSPTVGPLLDCSCLTSVLALQALCFSKRPSPKLDPGLMQ